MHDWAREVRTRLSTLRLSPAREAEIVDELSQHLDDRWRELIAGGTSADEATRVTLAEFRSGNVLARQMAELRQVHTPAAITPGASTGSVGADVRQDLRYAIRQLRKSPAFTCTATLVLALGIAATVTIFGLVEAALIRPLPYQDQSRLVSGFHSTQRTPQGAVSFLDFTDWKNLNGVFSSLDAYALNGGFTLRGESGAEQVTGTRVSLGFFGTLGVVPLLGRGFRADEDSAAVSPAVVITHGAWLTRFGERSDILGQTVILNGIPRTIVGVLPPEFHFAPAGRAEFWTTLRRSDACEQRRGCRNLRTVARLKDGVSLERAAAGIQLIAQQLQQQYPDSNRDAGSVTLVPLRNLVVGEVRPILLMLLAAALVLLLIAWLNVMTLLLARSDSRRREIAVRNSLGASYARLFQQFVIEAFVLSTVSGVVALGCAEWSMRILASLMLANRLDTMPYFRGLGLNFNSIAFAGLLSIVAAVLLAIIPAARFSRSPSMECLKEGMRGGGLRWRRFGTGIVVVEVALSMVLMTGAGLIGKSLYALLHVDTGMTPDRLVSATLRWPVGRYASDEEKLALGREITERISALPGVASVAISLTPPTGPAFGSMSFHVLGQPMGDNNEVLKRQVSSSYFTTLQARLFRGRYFSETDDASKPLVAIVNRSFAEQYFAGEDPIGKQIYADPAADKAMELVGVVDDIKEGPIQNSNLPVLYVPFEQNPVDWFAILVRTSIKEQTVLTAIAPTVHDIDRDISVSNVATMTAQINNSPAAYFHRSAAWLVGSFASAALVLGVVGLYGVVAYSVSQRTREIGVRMALGARPTSVYQLILGEVSGLVAAGTILGITGSLFAARLIRGLFFGMSSWDIQTITVVSAVLTVVSLFASYLPARRAASVSPVEALRSE
jgi:macrolide transport system ATP-binding/permease protein